MIIERAEEIMRSPNKIDVSYNNSPVWLENINRSNNTVRVKDLANNTIIEAPVGDLVESGTTLKM